jgi:hypothetical protein
MYSYIPFGYRPAWRAMKKKSVLKKYCAGYRDGSARPARDKEKPGKSPTRFLLKRKTRV